MVCVVSTAMAAEYKQMSQQDLSESQSELWLPKKKEAAHDNNKDWRKQREWLPEDDDEWYEPDYCRSERLNH